MARTNDERLIKEETHDTNATNRTVSLRSPRRPRRSWSGWVTSNVLRYGFLIDCRDVLIVTRIFAWYSIITVLFRCPHDTGAIGETDPKLCRPYLSIRGQLEPYLDPYYQTYAEPYVEKARPYVETANTRLIKPATVLAFDAYHKYAVPELNKAREYTWGHWEVSGRPQLRKAQDAAQQVYEVNVAPHVLKASEVAIPYYETAKDGALNVHENHILPALSNSKPYMVSAYSTTQKFVLEKGVPFAQNLWSHVIIFVDGTAWPFIKKVYGENVRPQLVMIGERIAKYQEGRKLQSVIEQVDLSSTASFDPTTETASTVQSADTATSVHSTTITTTNGIVSPTATIATDESIREDLAKWQQKFALAADKGTDDLRERIEGIATSLAKGDLPEGKGLHTALGKTIDVKMNVLQAKIKSVAGSLPESASSREIGSAEAELVTAIRDAGIDIKNAAAKIRQWRANHENNLRQRVGLATDSTLHVLDDIRDLGLQEIGMRWAWMDGVTYKHWQKYHDLKQKFADWRSEVREVAEEHPAIAKTIEQAEILQDESMATTEDAAKELARLVGVSKWKVRSRDTTDDFDTREIPVIAAAVSAAGSLTDGIKQAVLGNTPESSAVEDIVSSVVPDTKQISQSASHASKSGSSSISSASSEVQTVVEDQMSTASNVADSLTKRASSSAVSVASQASSVADEAGSSATSFASDVVDQTSIIVPAVEQPFASSVSTTASSLINTVTMSIASSLAPSDIVGTQAGSVIDSVTLSLSSVVASIQSQSSLI